MKKISQILLTIRPINVLVGIIYSYLAYWYVDEKDLALNFAFATGFGLAAGNIINDIYDWKSDDINKPYKARLYKLIGVRNAKMVYAFSVLFSVLMAVMSLNIGVILITLIANVLLYLYGKHGKFWGYLANYTVALLSALCIVSPLLTENNIPSYKFEILSMLSFIALAYSFMREWVKDFEDLKGDIRMAAKTGVIRMGIKRSYTLLRVYAFFLGVLLLYIPLVYKNYFYFIWLLLYIPILYYLLGSYSKKKMKYISSLLKVLFLSGLIVYFV